MRKTSSFPAPTALRRPFAAATVAELPPRVHPEVEAWAIRAAAANGFGGNMVVSGRGAARPDQAPAGAVVDRSRALASAVALVRRYMRRAAALLRLRARRARHLAALRQLQALDSAALRDLGLTRSEIGSVHAEAAGRAAATRRGVLEHEWFRFRADASAAHGDAS